MALSVAFSAIFDASAAVSDAFGFQNFQAPTQPEYGEILQNEWSDEPRVRRCVSIFPFLSDYRRVWEMDLDKDA